MKHFDVAITGGGPAGATLAALLAKKTSLRVALFEKDKFPRDHIGESFSHRIVGVLQESGALEKILASDCWVRKYGGFYAWNPERPAATFFDHHVWQKDGVHRWSMHVNRAEFDQILLEHARSLGVLVYDETEVVSVHGAEGGGHQVRLSTGEAITAAIFVEAAGRQCTFVSDQKKQWLSRFKNVAVWTHFLGAKPAQSLPGDWNPFREQNLSAIGSFAYRDGWCWFIPVKRWVDGERVETTSIGLITDGEALRTAQGDLRDAGTFLRHIRQVPLLADLIEDVTPLDDRLHVATNYSMISDAMCNVDERWVRLGDSAYFVDPLFSSGVAFALLHAQAACLLIKSTLEGKYDERGVRELWADYDTSLQRVARSFSIGIDHWYHAISERHPESTYWKRRSGEQSFLIDHADFQSLVDTDLAIPPDLKAVLGQGVGRGSPLDKVSGAIASGLPSANDPLQLSSSTELVGGLSLGVGGARGSPFPGEPEQVTASFWQDPLKNGDSLRSHCEEPVRCLYFRSGDVTVKAQDTPATRELRETLARGELSFAEAHECLAAPELRLLVDLIRAGLVAGQPTRDPAATR